MDEFRNIQRQEEKLRRAIKKFAPSEQTRILTALDFATKAHLGQTRDEGDPYIIHPIRVANTLASDLLVNDIDMIITGLLHDVVEDTAVSLDEINEQFGKRVGRVVAVLTRDKYSESKEKKFEKIVNGPEGIKIIKACDWLDNLRSFANRTDRGERWQRHLREAVDLYIPIAKATGNKWLVEEMEKAYQIAIKLT